MFLGIIVETCIMVCFLYIPGLNNAIMARPLDIFSVGYYLFKKNSWIDVLNALDVLGRNQEIFDKKLQLQQRTQVHELVRSQFIMVMMIILFFYSSKYIYKIL